MGACRSRTNADDRLTADPLGRIEGRDGIVEGCYVADVRPQPPVPQPPDDLTQLGTIGHDNKVDRQAVHRPRLGRAGDGHQCSSGPDHACGPPLDVSADDVEHQVDSADVFQRVVLKVDELHRAEVERLLTVDAASGADDVRAGLTHEPRHHRPDCAGRAVHEHALPRLKAAVLEQSSRTSQRMRSRRNQCNRANVYSTTQRYWPSPEPCSVTRRAMTGVTPTARTCLRYLSWTGRKTPRSATPGRCRVFHGGQVGIRLAEVRPGFPGLVPLVPP